MRAIIKGGGVPSQFHGGKFRCRKFQRGPWILCDKFRRHSQKCCGVYGFAGGATHNTGETTCAQTLTVGFDLPPWQGQPKLPPKERPSARGSGGILRVLLLSPTLRPWTRGVPGRPPPPPKKRNLPAHTLSHQITPVEQGKEKVTK